MIDHVDIHVSDYAASKAYFLQALAPLGYELIMEFDVPEVPGGKVCGLGACGQADFWLTPTTKAIVPTHIAFAAKSPSEVDAFHRASLAAGGEDNGPPGPRPHYHPGYYGAFVRGPDGYNVEAVIHDHK